VVNPAEAPRAPKCRVCTYVATPADVTIRLFDPELLPLPLDGAVEYLRAVGFAGTNRQVQAIALSHRRHIEKWMEHAVGIAPAHIESGVSKIPRPMGDTRWIDLNQRGMDVGSEALALLSQRIATGGMEDKDVIAAAKLGQAAASTRANLELKGALKRAEALAKLAAGFTKPAEA
jgi:hypothetical protein